MRNLNSGCIVIIPDRVNRPGRSHQGKGRYINRAQDIINELNAVLDMEAGGEIADNLRKLYHFMNNRLSEANNKRDPQMVREVISMMEELNKSWKTIAG